MLGPSIQCRLRHRICGCGCVCIVWMLTWFTSGNVDAEDWSATYESVARPLLKQYCFECHCETLAEAELNLESFESFQMVRQRLGDWVKVRRMLASHQMPPKESAPLSESQHQRLTQWVTGFLKQEALATAGDPGPVILRRLSNDEYNYSVRDLTGVESLDPTREFPVDGAAGEGFTNTGSAQAMSPAMAVKYLGAAKDVASHAVLLPDGLQFSPYITRRDHTDQWLAKIQEFYRRFASEDGGSAVNLQGIKFDTNQGGRLPLKRYLTALAVSRERLRHEELTIDQLAEQHHLSPKYLRTLWENLEAAPTAANPFLSSVRQAWQALPSNGVEQSLGPLLTNIASAQERLWKFNAVGQLTTGGKQKTWMEPVSPVVERAEFARALTDNPSEDVSIWFASDNLTDTDAYLVWERPRLEFASDHPPILVQDVPGMRERVARQQRIELPRTQQYLEVLAKSHRTGETLAESVEQAGLDLPLAKRWAELVRVGAWGPRAVGDLLKTKIARAHGHDSVNGWGVSETPSMLTNSSQEDVRFLTLVVPARGVVMHPSPTQESIAAWKSPVSAELKIRGIVADADDKCGNGAAWRLVLASAEGPSILAQGAFDNGGKNTFEAPGSVEVVPGDVISLVVNARDNSHACDTTHIQWTLAAKERKWDLAQDVVDRITESNPLPDSHGHADVWHFAASRGGDAKPQIVPESSLAAWRQLVVSNASEEAQQAAARKVQQQVNGDAPLSPADQQQRSQLLRWTGPLRWAALSQSGDSGDAQRPDDSRPQPATLLGIAQVNGSAVAPSDICIAAGEKLRLEIPAELAEGAKLAAVARLHASTETGAVQVHVGDGKLDSSSSVTGPCLTVGAGRRRLEQALQQFRDLFPPALCYARIVPVDEVVTMTLYFREDDHLQRLMLDESQVAELDRLWDEMLYVAREPLALTVAFEQIVEFATQDRPDLVKEFTPMRESIFARAARFRQHMEETQPAHLAAVSEFASRAWRRSLTEDDQNELHAFYSRLRESDVEHEAAIRLLLSRVLASPAFLYRHEQQPTGVMAEVSDSELASRLSYFLWSSTPDKELHAAAQSGTLTTDEALKSQTRRMLTDARMRRLAVQFACQWMHLRDFDQNDDKNERLYPEFASLRGDMYEEIVLFFETMFRENRSILEMLDADHTHLNPRLAKHYQVSEFDGDGWRRVTGWRAEGRGGVMGMAALLASQSGASRTSPILRGNWVYETLLGERLPRPPANVPQLPESVPEGLTARQLIEQHSSTPGCAKCHEKIDPYGFSLEQFDAIGRRRPVPQDTQAKLPDGAQIDGLGGLREYLLSHRRDDFVRQFCRKLLGFSLGREVLLSDEPLLDTMQERLAAGEYRFHIAVETIVMSQQFRRIRGAEHAAPAD